MAKQPKSPWLEVVSETRERCLTLPTAILTSVNEFNEAFEEACARHGETHSEARLSNVMRQLRPLRDFAKQIDSSGNMQPPNCMTSLFYTILYAIMQSALACETTMSLLDFLKHFKVLNENFPALGNDVGRYPFEATVQKPLQNMFTCYFNCCIDIITHLRSENALSFEELYPRFEAAGATFGEERSDWEKAVQTATTTDFSRYLSITRGIQSTGANGNFYDHRPGEIVNFAVEDFLSPGGRSFVYRVKEMSTGQVYARKSIPLPSDDKSRAQVVEKVQREVDIMHKLRHHHIVSVLFHVKEANWLSIFMLPVASNNLLQFLEYECPEKGFAKSTVRRIDAWFGCLAAALTFAHCRDIRHEDVKPSNILIEKDKVYLADFGSAKDFSLVETSSSPEEMFAGTRIYASPEKRRGRAADVFALGCVFSEMITIRFERSLQDYRNARELPDTDDRLAFWRNLPKVTEWLKGFQNHSDDHLQLAVAETLKMLEENPDNRPKARSLKKRFRAEERLFCELCD